MYNKISDVLNGYRSIKTVMIEISGKVFHKWHPSIFKVLKPNLLVLTELVYKLPPVENRVMWLCNSDALIKLMIP